MKKCEKLNACTDADSWFSEHGPRGNLLSTGHVWVSIGLERRLELLQLDAGEVCPLSSSL